MLHGEFGFETDVCAVADNAKCFHYYTPEINGLTQTWTGVCWMNPPYGREISKWVEKASSSDALVVALLPARTDTRWWHSYCQPILERLGTSYVRFLNKRLEFSGFGNKAPFPSVVVIFPPLPARPKGELSYEAHTRACSTGIAVMAYPQRNSYPATLGVPRE